MLAAAAPVIGAAIGPSTASAGPIVYVAGTGGEFGTLDLATGDFTSIGTLNPSSGAEIVGMGFGPDGNLYGLDFIQPNANLYQIDITNANSTLVGAIDHTAYGASTDAAGKVYALSQDDNALFYTLDPPSRTTTVVGPTGLAGFFLAAVDAGGSQFFAGAPNPTTGTVRPLQHRHDDGCGDAGRGYGLPRLQRAVRGRHALRVRSQRFRYLHHRYEHRCRHAGCDLQPAQRRFHHRRSRACPSDHPRPRAPAASPGHDRSGRDAELSLGGASGRECPPTGRFSASGPRLITGGVLVPAEPARLNGPAS